MSQSKPDDSSNKTTTIIVWFLGASALCCMIAVIVMVCWRRVATEKAREEKDGINLEFLLDPNAPIDDSNFLNALDAPMKIPKQGIRLDTLNDSQNAVIYNDMISNKTPQGPSFQTKSSPKTKNKRVKGRSNSIGGNSDVGPSSFSRKNKDAYFDRLSDEEDINDDNDNNYDNSNSNNSNNTKQRKQSQDLLDATYHTLNPDSATLSYTDASFNNINNSMELNSGAGTGGTGTKIQSKTKKRLSLGDKLKGNKSKNSNGTDAPKQQRRQSYTFEDGTDDEDDPYMLANTDSEDEVHASQFGRLN